MDSANQDGAVNDAPVVVKSPGNAGAGGGTKEADPWASKNEPTNYAAPEEGNAAANNTTAADPWASMDQPAANNDAPAANGATNTAAQDPGASMNDLEKSWATGLGNSGLSRKARFDAPASNTAANNTPAADPWADINQPSNNESAPAIGVTKAPAVDIETPAANTAANNTPAADPWADKNQGTPAANTAANNTPAPDPWADMNQPLGSNQESVPAIETTNAPAMDIETPAVNSAANNTPAADPWAEMNQETAPAASTPAADPWGSMDEPSGGGFQDDKPSTPAADPWSSNAVESPEKQASAPQTPAADPWGAMDQETAPASPAGQPWSSNAVTDAPVVVASPAKKISAPPTPAVDQWAAPVEDGPSATPTKLKTPTPLKVPTPAMKKFPINTSRDTPMVDHSKSNSRQWTPRKKTSPSPASHSHSRSFFGKSTHKKQEKSKFEHHTSRVVTPQAGSDSQSEDHSKNNRHLLAKEGNWTTMEVKKDDSKIELIKTPAHSPLVRGGPVDGLATSTDDRLHQRIINTSASNDIDPHKPLGPAYLMGPTHTHRKPEPRGANRNIVEPHYLDPNKPRSIQNRMANDPRFGSDEPRSQLYYKTPYQHPHHQVHPHYLQPASAALEKECRDHGCPLPVVPVAAPWTHNHHNMRFRGRE